MIQYSTPVTSDHASAEPRTERLNVPELVRLTVVPDPGEAEVICSLLRSEAIDFTRSPLPTAFSEGGGIGGWTEIFVRDIDLPRAQELIATAAE